MAGIPRASTPLPHSLSLSRFATSQQRWPGRPSDRAGGHRPGRRPIASVRQTIPSVGGIRDTYIPRAPRLVGFASADVPVLVNPRVSVSEKHMFRVLVERRLERQLDELPTMTVRIDPS